MDEPRSADHLIRRLRAGDPAAAAELVRRHEPAVRRRVRVWLRLQDPALARAFDSMDVCQSVMASFFARAAAGQFDLDSPAQVAALLARMARHKLLHHVARHTAARRDLRRDRHLDPGADGVAQAAAAPGPDALAAGRDLLEQVRRRLAPDERSIAELRGDGRDWPAVAAALGGSPEARRKQLARALDRVAAELGLDHGDLG